MLTGKIKSAALVAPLLAGVRGEGHGRSGVFVPHVNFQLMHLQKTIHIQNGGR